MTATPTDKKLSERFATSEPASYYRDTLSDVIAELKATAEADSPGDPTSIAAQAAERLEAMSATLSPFSVEYSRYENEDGTNFIGNSRLRVGDLRLARAALDKPQAMSEAKMSDDTVNRAFVIACCREPVGAGDGDTYVVSPPTMESMRAALEFALRLAESHPSAIKRGQAEYRGMEFDDAANIVETLLARYPERPPENIYQAFRMVFGDPAPDPSAIREAVEQERELIKRAYLGVSVLRTMLQKEGMRLGVQAADDLMADMASLMPELPGTLALRSRTKDAKS